MKTIALTNDKWDIYTNEYGNIAMKEANERLAQDVASSVRVFKSECKFDLSRGVEYNKPDESRQTLNRQMNEQAIMIEGVEDSITIFEKLEDRKLKPVIYVTNVDNEQVVVGE